MNDGKDREIFEEIMKSISLGDKIKEMTAYMPQLALRVAMTRWPINLKVLRHPQRLRAAVQRLLQVNQIDLLSVSLRTCRMKWRANHPSSRSRHPTSKPRIPILQLPAHSYGIECGYVVHLNDNEKTTWKIHLVLDAPNYKRKLCKSKDDGNYEELEAKALCTKRWNPPFRAFDKNEQMVMIGLAILLYHSLIGSMPRQLPKQRCANVVYNLKRAMERYQKSSKHHNEVTKRWLEEKKEFQQREENYKRKEKDHMEEIKKLEEQVQRLKEQGNAELSDNNEHSPSIAGIEDDALSNDNENDDTPNDENVGNLPENSEEDDL